MEAGNAPTELLGRRVRYHGPGHWVPLPLTQLGRHHVTWRIEPDNVGWRLFPRDRFCDALTAAQPRRHRRRPRVESSKPHGRQYMRGKCKGAKVEIDVRLLEAATISVEARPYRKVADIRIETVNTRITWEADVEMLQKLREMFQTAEQALTESGGQLRPGEDSS